MHITSRTTQGGKITYHSCIIGTRLLTQCQEILRYSYQQNRSIFVQNRKLQAMDGIKMDLQVHNKKHEKGQI